MATTPDVLTVGDVAAFMRVSRETVYRLAARGELPGRKIGRIWRFPKDAIQKYVHGESVVGHARNAAHAREPNIDGSGDGESSAEQPRPSETLQRTAGRKRPGTVTCVLGTLLLALGMGSSALAQDGQGPVKIGVLAERGTERCLEKWGPTAEYLTEQIPGCSFVIVPLSHDEVCPTVERGEVDFVFANSSLYVEAEARYGVNRLATFKKPRLAGVFSVYGGVILCRADREDIQELSDLKGGTFMAVKETSFGGWRAVWRELKTKGINPQRDFTELLFGGTHDAVVYAVRDGQVDAGCVRTNTLEYMTMEGKIRREQFRVLGEHSWDEYPFLNSTPMYPEWPIAKVAHTSDELAEKVAVALIGMPADCPAAKAAKCAGWTVPLCYQPVHKCLKELRIGPYKDYGKVTPWQVFKQYWRWLVAGAAFLAVMTLATLYVLQLNRRLNRSRLELARDITGRKWAEEVLRKVNRALLVRSRCSRAVVRAAKEPELLQSVCRAFVETGGYRLAWVGFAEQDEARNVRPVAQAGFEVAYLETVNITWADSERGRGPTGTAIRTGRPCAARRILTDRAFAPWRSEAIKRGYSSSLALPLRTNGQTFGALNVYSAEPDAFDMGETELLTDLANDLAYGITALRMRAERKQAEHKLRESEDKFRSLVETTSDLVWEVDQKGFYTYISPTVKNILGYEPEEVIGKTPFDFMPADEAERVARFFRDSAESREPFAGLENTNLHRDGRHVVLETNGVPVFDAGGNLLGYRGIDRDITERKRAEEELRESEEKHRGLTENLPQRIFHKDAHLVYVSCNKHYARDLGIARDEIAGKTDFDFYPKELAEKYRVGDRRTMESGQTEEVEESYIRDGQELFVQTVKTPLTDDAGNVTGILGIFWDITERKRAKAELQGVHTETKQLLESIPLVLIALDANDRVTSWNSSAERAFGIVTMDAVGQLLDDLEIEWDHGTVARAITECRAKSRLTRVDELRFKPTGGTGGFLSIAANPLSADRGERANVLLVAADITEQRILEGQLAQAQKLESIGQLAAGIAHEINTPTQFVGDNTRFLQDAFGDLQGLLDKYAQLAEAGRTGSVTPEILADVAAAAKEADLEYLKEQIPEAITQSLEGIERVANIVRAMKDFSHPGTEGKEAADLNQAIESTITVARNEWKYVAEMVTEFDPALPPVPCLVGDFNQVILNIVINAAHAIADVVGRNTGEKGTITITTRRDGGWAEIRISDTGTGISEEHRSKVFDHFFTTKEVGKGTGQGLAIAYAVVTEKHGGAITLETEMGQGTTFIIRLPIGSESPTAEEMPSHEEAHSLR